MRSAHDKLSLSRRRFLSYGFMAAVAAGFRTQGAPTNNVANAPRNDGPTKLDDIEPFWGTHQGGILTPLQRNTYFAVFDLIGTEGNHIATLLQAWTEAAA